MYSAANWSSEMEFWKPGRPAPWAPVRKLAEAWCRVRSVRAAIAALSQIVMLPNAMLQRSQANEHLDPNTYLAGEQVKWDWALINAWGDAARRLKDDADVALPGVGA